MNQEVTQIEGRLLPISHKVTDGAIDVGKTLAGHFPHLVWAAVAIFVFFFGMSHFFPGGPQRITGPVAIFTPKPAESTIQSAINSVRQAQQIANSVNRVQSIESAVFNALSAATAQRVSVGSRITTTASAAPLPKRSSHFDSSDINTIYVAAKKADRDVLTDPNTHIDTHVTIDRVEVQPGRVATAVNSMGWPGVGIDIIRKKQYNVELAGLKTPAGHIAPMIGLEYMIPHTQLSVGPSVTFDHQVRAGLSIGVHFGPQ